MSIRKHEVNKRRGKIILWRVILVMSVLGLLSFFAVLGHAGEPSIYGTLTMSGNVGNRMGLGISGAYNTSPYNDFVLDGRVGLTNQKKLHADKGYTYSGSLYLDGNFGGFRLGVGTVLSGYRSEFSDGRVWKKRYVVPAFRAGYVAPHYKVYGSITGKEQETENKVQSAGLKVVMGKNWIYVVSAGVSRYTQQHERRTGYGITWGFGYKWRYGQ